MSNTDLFDREIKALFDQSIETLTERYGSTVIGKGKKEITCLNRYKAIYKAMTPSEFHDDFKTLFEKKKSVILKSLDDDTWLKNDNIVIKFGEKIKALRDKCENIKIMLSNIYNAALELQEMTKNNLEDLSENLVSDIVATTGKNLIRPPIILLHLLRIFYAIVDDEDKIQLAPLINTLETELNVKNRTIKNTIIQSAAADNNSNAVDGIASIFNMVTSALKNAGVAMPDEIQAPTTQQFSDIISSFANNEGIKTAFQGIAQALNTSGLNGGTELNNLNQFAQNALQNILKPDTLQMVKESVLQTAEIAKES
ncbi:MAG TPA: hypothetical protein VLG50_08130 [Candidatus Saccharimonadales bacterium]|nr:hypothetical protein [Candidatus Saccharimonadales bacterium]